MTTKKTKTRRRAAPAMLKINVHRERPVGYWELSDGDNAGQPVLCDDATSRYFPETAGSVKGTFTLTPKRRPGSVKIEWKPGGGMAWRVNGNTHDHADPITIGSALDGLKGAPFYATFTPAKVAKPKTVTVTARFTFVPGALNVHQPAGAIVVGGPDLRVLLGMDKRPVGASDGAYQAKVEVIK